MATETSDDKLHSRVTYDFSKVITGIDLLISPKKYVGGAAIVVLVTATLMVKTVDEIFSAFRSFLRALLSHPGLWTR